MDLSMLLAFIPEPWRTYVVAVLFAFLATQVVASAIVAVLPAAAFKWRPLRALSWYAHLAPRDAAGTFKLPFRAPLQPGAMEDLARLQRAVEALQRGAAPPATPRETQAPPPPQAGFVRVAVLLWLCATVLVASMAGAVLTGCPNWNRPACPTPGVYSCVANRPHYCAPTRELTPIGDESCSEQHRVCALNDAGVARCAPAVDGGAPEGGVQ